MLDVPFGVQSVGDLDPLIPASKGPEIFPDG